MTNDFTPSIVEYRNAFGHIRYAIDFGPSIYRPGQRNLSIKRWKTKDAARKAIKRQAAK